MKRFVEGADRGQSTLLPECLDEWVEESNSVRVVDSFVDALDLAISVSRRRACSDRPTCPPPLDASEALHLRLSQPGVVAMAEPFDEEAFGKRIAASLARPLCGSLVPSIAKDVSTARAIRSAISSFLFATIARCESSQRRARVARLPR
jgi:hypothetical protein